MRRHPTVALRRGVRRGVAVPLPLSDLGESVTHGKRSALSAYRSVRRVLPREAPSTTATPTEHPLQLREVPQDVSARPSHDWRVANGQGTLLLWPLPSGMASYSASTAYGGSRDSAAIAGVSGGGALVADSRGARHCLGNAIAARRFRTSS